MDKPEDLSDRESEARVFVPVVLDVTDVLVSPSSVVTKFCDSFFLHGVGICGTTVISFSKKRAHSCTVTQVRFDGPQVEAPPLSGRTMMPPTPLQKSYSSFEEEHFETEDQMWSSRDRTVIAKTKQYLEESKSKFEGGNRRVGFSAGPR